MSNIAEPGGQDTSTIDTANPLAAASGQGALLIDTLSTALAATAIPVRAVVEEFILREADYMVDALFTRLHENSTIAESFGGSDREQLSGSVSYWLRGLFTIGEQDAFDRVILFSRKIGELHARINIQFWEMCSFRNILLEIGLDKLGESFSDFQKLDEIRTYYSCAINNCFDYIIQIYFASLIEKSLFFDGFRKNILAANIIEDSHEKKYKIREWFDEVLHSLYRGQYSDLLPISNSRYGIWWRHKGKVLFDQMEDSLGLDVAMENIDHFIRLRRFGDTSSLDKPFDISMLDDLELLVKELEYHHDNLFEKARLVGRVTDHLTSLLDKRMISGLLSKEVNNSAATGKPFSLLMIDIDNFKSVNDTYGHQVGDLVIRRLATVILSEVRGGDYVFRYGGEEVLVVLVEADKTVAATIAERIRGNLEREKIDLESGESMGVTISIGVAQNDGVRDYQKSLTLADEALYAAKEDGKNCVKVA